MPLTGASVLRNFHWYNPHRVQSKHTHTHVCIRVYESTNTAVITTIGLPAALEHWSNEQVLNFIHLMWEKSAYSNDEKVEEKELDPLHFLNGGVRDNHNGNRAAGPLDANTVVDVANRAFASLGENGEDVFTRSLDTSFESPVTVDAIIIESSSNCGDSAAALEQLEEVLGRDAINTESESKTNDGDDHDDDGGKADTVYAWTADNFGSKSFVASPVAPAATAIPDPARKKRIVDWLCSNIKHLNALSQNGFNTSELWRLHQHFFSPVVNETGGPIGGTPTTLSEENVARIVSSVPDVNRRNGMDLNSVTPSTQSSQEALPVPLSDPSLPASPAALPMLKRKVSYRSLGDAIYQHGGITPTIAGGSSAGGVVHGTRLHERKQHQHRSRDPTVARMLEESHVSQMMPPRNKRARRNKTRISFLPRIKVCFIASFVILMMTMWSLSAFDCLRLLVNQLMKSVVIPSFVDSTQLNTNVARFVLCLTNIHTHTHTPSLSLSHTHTNRQSSILIWTFVTKRHSS